MWRPAGEVVRDGGFRRAYEIFDHFPNDVRLTMIDRRPSLLHPRPNFRLSEYDIPSWIGLLGKRAGLLGGLIEVLWVVGLLLIQGSREIKRSRDSVLYVPASEIPWLTLPAYLLSVIFRRRLVLVNLNTKGGGLIRWVLWRLHARADQVIAISKAIKSELEAVGVSGRIEVNSCGFTRGDNVEPLAPAPLWAATFVGRLQPQKGIHDLIRVWSLIIPRFPDAQLLMVGHASAENRRRLLEHRRQLGLDDNVELVGVLTDQQKWRALAESRIFLFLSHTEGWGLAPIEALSVGLPVIAYDLPCYVESLDGLQGVYRVPLGDVSAAAEQVIELLDLAPVAYDALREKTRSSFKYPDWHEIALRELQLIEGN